MSGYGRLRVRLEFKLADLWVGAFFRKLKAPGLRARQYDVWICLIPCFPIHFTWHRKPETPEWPRPV